MDPQEIRRLLRKWALLVIIFTGVGGAAAYGVSRTLTPKYESDGSLLVLAALQQQAGQANSLPATTTQVTSTYAVLMTASPLLQQVAGELDLRETPEELGAQIKVTPERDTQILRVAVTDASPDRAQRIANQLLNDFLANRNKEQGEPINPAAGDMDTLRKTIQDDLDTNQQQLASIKPSDKTADPASISSRIKSDRTLLSIVGTIATKLNTDDSQRPPKVALVSPARLPTTPASPRVMLNGLLGLFGGLLAGLGLVALFEYFDQSLRSEEDVRRRLGMATLGVIPTFSSTPGSSRSARRRNEHAAEAFRRLRTNLKFCVVDRPLRTVVVTSSRQGEGKTSTSANLARIIAASGQQVLLADADMRRPNQHVLFSKPLLNGMSELLLGAARGAHLSINGEHHTDFRNLSLLTAGVIPPNPAELLASKQAAEVINDLGARNDLVVLDTPPVGVVTDAMGIAATADATIIVVKAGGSARHASRTIEALRGVGANVVGVVLNKAKDRNARGYYYYEGYYGYGMPAAGAERGNGAGQDEAIDTWIPIAQATGQAPELAASPPPAPPPASWR